MEKYGTRSDGKLSKGGGGKKKKLWQGFWEPGESAHQSCQDLWLWARAKIIMLVPQRKIKRGSWASRAWISTCTEGDTKPWAEGSAPVREITR